MGSLKYGATASNSKKCLAPCEGSGRTQNGVPELSQLSPAAVRPLAKAVTLACMIEHGRHAATTAAGFFPRTSIPLDWIALQISPLVARFLVFIRCSAAAAFIRDDCEFPRVQRPWRDVG